MNKIHLPLLLSLLGVALMTWAGCTNSTPSSGTGGLSGAVTVTYGGSLNYNPSSVTINAGQAVLFTGLSGHTVDIDNGAGTNTCMANYTSFPVAVTLTNSGTYYFHCNDSGHSTCAGKGTCPSSTSGCTGMVGTVLVN